VFTHRRKNIGEAKVGLTKHHSRVPPFFEKLPNFFACPRPIYLTHQGACIIIPGEADVEASAKRFPLAPGLAYPNPSESRGICVNKKVTKSSTVETCPVPPWNTKTILKLAQFLVISQAELARLTGVSYSMLRAWISGRTREPARKTQDLFKKLEKKIPALRKAALGRIAAKLELESQKVPRLAKPWPINRIRSFMHVWGMSQYEFAIFCGVSYDTVTSWSRGRRRLVRSQTAELVEAAEKAAQMRGFPVAGPNVKRKPWEGLRTLGGLNRCLAKLSPIKNSLIGTFGVCAVETLPQKCRLGTPVDKILISRGKQNGSLNIKLSLGKSSFNLTGRWKKLGGCDYVELNSEKDDPTFFSSAAGCLTPGARLLRLSLWSPKKGFPIRLLARAS